MNNDKKYLIKYLAVCIVSFLLCGGVSAYFLLSPEFESSNRKYAAIGIVLCLVAVLGGVLKYSDYYNKNIKPVKDPESLIDDRANAYRMYADKKLPGKDIYDVFRRYRRSFLWGRLMIIPVCLILIELLMVVKFQQVGWDIRWALVIGVAVVILALIIAGKKEMEFSTEEDLRKAIEKSKVDPVRLNADFMMSSCYKTSYGAIFIGSCDAPEDAQFVDDLIFQKTGRRATKISGIGPVIGSHSGPGTLALFFVSEDER